MTKKSVKSLLEAKLAENTQRHAAAHQETKIDFGRNHLKIPVDKINPNPYQPRCTSSQANIEELAVSISEAGQIQPILVRRHGDRYQIVAGERRWRAHQLLGRHTIEALVCDVEDADMAVHALTENLQRENLSDYEIGKALHQIEGIFPNRTKLAEALGIPRKEMYRYLAFLGLPLWIQERLDSKPRLISRSAAESLKRVIDTNQDATALDEGLRKCWNDLEVGELEQTKLASAVLKCLNDPILKKRTNRAPINLTRAGRRIGSILRDDSHLMLKLKINALSPEQEQKLQEFVQTELLCELASET